MRKGGYMINNLKNVMDKSDYQYMISHCWEVVDKAACNDDVEIIHPFEHEDQWEWLKKYAEDHETIVIEKDKIIKFSNASSIKLDLVV